MTITWEQIVLFSFSRDIKNVTNKGSTNNPTEKSVSASERNKILEGRWGDDSLERAAKITVLPNVEEMARNIFETTRDPKVLVPFKTF